MGLFVKESKGVEVGEDREGGSIEKGGGGGRGGGGVSKFMGSKLSGRMSRRHCFHTFR